MNHFLGKNAEIYLRNGLGDKLTDLLGFCVICEILGVKPNVFFNNNTYPTAWGMNYYNLKYFNFQDVNVFNKRDDVSNIPIEYFIDAPNPSTTLSPYKVLMFLKKFVNDMTIESLSEKYISCAKKIIKPSQEILENIPVECEKAYGIHLRKTDKVSETGYQEYTHISKLNEFDIMTNKLLEDVGSIILNENEPTFLIVSEDFTWKNHMKGLIENIALKNNKTCKIIKINYLENDNDNFNSVLDMFCLSRCKEILQGVKYTTFSMIASIIGTQKIRNYFEYTETKDICYIHLWNSVLEINGKKNFDLTLHERISTFIMGINSNIE